MEAILDILLWLDHWLMGVDPYGIQVVAYTLYNIWFCRNQVLFNAGKFIPSLVAVGVVERV